MPGVLQLAAAEAAAGIPLALLSAHMLECLLKAFLSCDGKDGRLKTHKLRHDLVGLWDLAVREGLPWDTERPSWVSTLGGLHDRPYYLRYSTGIHAISTPVPDDLSQGLRELLEVVRVNARRSRTAKTPSSRLE